MILSMLVFLSHIPSYRKSLARVPMADCDPRPRFLVPLHLTKESQLTFPLLFSYWLDGGDIHCAAPQFPLASGAVR